MNVRELLGKRMLFFDGGMGSMLQKNGMGAGEIPELLNLTNAALIEKIHTEYLEAGANIITTNTFGANPLKSEEIGESLDMIIAAAIGIARKAVNSFQSEENPRFVAFDIGPCGKLLEPLGDLSFDDCYDAFAKIAKTAEKCGADLVIIETMSDTLEAKAAVLAVKENTSLPIFCTMTFDESYKTLTGGDVKVMSAIMEGLGVDCVGINCGLGPAQIGEMMTDLAEISSIPIMAQPNAGLPQIENGKTVYNVLPEQFADECEHMAKLGASVLGGCCGTTPDHIRSLVEKCKNYKPIVEEKNITVVASYSKTVVLGKGPVIVGERINPTGKKKFKEAQGGVLFIDEAYSLCDSYENGFGDEAINTIVQEMENHRDDVIVIFAGYPEPMKEFLDRNPGMRSRIAFCVEFADYTTEELCEITELMLAKKQITITELGMKKLKKNFESIKESRDYGNGRFARKMLEEAEMNLAERICQMSEMEITKEMLTTINESDIPDVPLGERRQIKKIGFAC